MTNSQPSAPRLKFDSAAVLAPFLCLVSQSVWAVPCGPGLSGNCDPYSGPPIEAAAPPNGEASTCVLSGNWTNSFNYAISVQSSLTGVMYAPGCEYPHTITMTPNQNGFTVRADYQGPPGGVCEGAMESMTFAAGTCDRADGTWVNDSGPPGGTDTWIHYGPRVKINLDPLPQSGNYVITAEPKMPTITATPQIVNVSPDPTGSASYSWSVNLSTTRGSGEKVAYQSFLDQPRSTTGTLPFSVSTLDPSILVGGALSINVFATIDAITYSGTTQSDYPNLRIVGTNPSRSLIQAEVASSVSTRTFSGLSSSDVSDAAARIACQESAQRQFYAAAGGGVAKPLISPDNGVGIFQVTSGDPFSTPNVVFNWKENVDKGVSIIKNKVTTASKFPSSLRAAADYQSAIANVVNPQRVAMGLSPIGEFPAPSFSTAGTMGSASPNRLLEDAVRGYNGWAGPRRYGLVLHEFEPDINFLIAVPDDQLSTLSANQNVWMRVSASQRGSSGDPDYVTHVTGKSPACS